VELFGQLADLIRMYRTEFNDARFRVDILGLSAIELHRALAIETLTKAFYSEDLLYELEECVTRISPGDFLADLQLVLK
jgi:hypothetical protein